MTRAVLGLLLLLLGAPLVRAQGLSAEPPRRYRYPPALDPFTGVVTSCRLDVRVFRTLRYGAVDYCRAHLAYHSGVLDCYRFVDEVCTVFLPASSTLTETRQQGSPEVFPCPDGPEPPVCPRLTVR